MVQSGRSVLNAWGISGAISISGFITKSRSCMSGWGSVSSGVSSTTGVPSDSKQSSRSMSITLSLYAPFTDLRARPISRSISCVILNTSNGRKAVFVQRAALRKVFSEVNPHGAVA